MKKKILKNIYKELDKTDSFFDGELIQIMRIIEKELLVYEFKKNKLEKVKSEVNVCGQKLKKYLKNLKKYGLGFGAENTGFIKMKKK